MANRIAANLAASARMFYRNKSAVFWTLAFPIMLILIFGAIFNGMGEGKANVHVQDLADTDLSHAFVENLTKTDALNIIEIGKDANIDDYIKENSPNVVLIIPANFDMAFMPGAGPNTTTLEIRSDPTSTTGGIVTGIVSGMSNQINLMLASGTNVMTVATSDLVKEQKFTYVDFFIPGIIAMTTMTTTIFWMVSLQTRYKQNGIFKKLITTPLTRFEWLAAQILWQLVVVFISVFVIMLVGIFIFNVRMTLDIVSILIIIFSSAMFSSMGMIIARFVKDEETAGSAANAITFPMMFLSGLFFQIEFMPVYLQRVADVLPLTYVANGLRDSMVYGNMSGAIYNLAVVAVVSIAFFIVGVLVSTWKTE